MRLTLYWYYSICALWLSAPVSPPVDAGALIQPEAQNAKENHAWPGKNLRMVVPPHKQLNKAHIGCPQTQSGGGFLNVKLDEAQKSAFYRFADENRGFHWLALDDALSQGVKFGATYDRENQAYVVTLTGALVVGSNERYCSTSRAGTLDEAIAVAMYKHDVMAQGDYSDFMPRTGTFKQWG